MSRTLLIILLATIFSESISLKQLCTTVCICGYATFKATKLHYVVDCVRTDLENFPDIKQLPPHFAVLDVSQNKIKNLTFYNEDFASAPLKILSARYNEIEEMSAEFMRSAPSLNRLDVSHNKITRLDNDLFHGNPALHHLDLSYNNIDKLPEGVFKNLKGLKFLDISYNYQLGIQIEGYKNLQSSPLGIHKNLTTFNANCVNLTHIPSRFFENLTLVDVSLTDNNLVELPILPETLKNLDLSGNHFKRIDAHHMNYINLKTLKLNHLYNLENIKPYAFYNLQSLETLSIENCPYLKHFDNLVFGLLVDGETWSMKEISLAGNGLRSLNDTYYKMFSRLERVDLDDNPWICDCNVLWFGMLEGKILHKNLRCASPRKFRDKYIISLSEEDIPQCARGLAWRTDKVLIISIVFSVFLKSIMVYLIYLRRFRNRNNRIHPIGVSSPYNTLVDQDELPY